MVRFDFIVALSSMKVIDYFSAQEEEERRLQNNFMSFVIF
jgi:hypothetical protein